MNTETKTKFISNWINEYLINSGLKTLVIGISGGIDSSVSSTLCAMTGKRTIVVSMPILKHPDLHDLSLLHANWLKSNFNNIEHHIIDLGKTFDSFKIDLKGFDNDHGYANSQSRLRMTTLYQIAASNNGIVVGTGNKVEDFGIGFYTKYGDGGVDISPIADCMKTEVWDIGKYLNIPEDIINAEPTDGLWEDRRTDERQVGLNYAQMEEAMIDENSSHRSIYEKFHNANRHKMIPIPICKIPK